MFIMNWISLLTAPMSFLPCLTPDTLIGRPTVSVLTQPYCLSVPVLARTCRFMFSILSSSWYLLVLFPTLIPLCKWVVGWEAWVATVTPEFQLLPSSTFVATAQWLSWETSLSSSTTYLTKLLSEVTAAKGAYFAHVAGKAFATQLQC